MQADVLIDGYNLLHAAGLARVSYGPGDLERCRQRLLHRIRHGLDREQRSRTIVVFDGRGSDFRDSSEFRFHGMLVVFSAPGEEADDTIEEQIASHSAPKQLVVVSSDHRLHKSARARRATAIDSEQFLKEIDSRSSHDPAPKVVEKPELPENVDVWMDEFRDLDIDQIEKEVVRETRQKRDALDAQRADLRKKAANSAKSQAKPADSNSASKRTGKRNDRSSNHDSEEPSRDSDDEIFDLDFWESRIEELDQDGI
ncbi:YacP-like NYN domain protein [Thalassoglobus neptunius]|uniref:YacP-like NYN domain protein n=1 Tax=Thalassoglobus neptunius TaxID=1938619 RepID=A0A5C5X7S2_9PLAN|nr:NYN domain-containing protein [Thalassoglobus neptunius]TWT58719.1 YacP-like NYN domain protein [Thalassoglobus neptunius]